LRKKSERVEETENLMKEAYEIKIQQLVNQIKYQDEVIGRREEEIASEK
jgi:tetrahydromethanopterin S-methyltransferase subunit F